MPPLSEQLRPIGARNGREGFHVTALGFGAAPISGADVHAAIDAVHSAKNAGVGFFDTAPWYGRGASEHRLGLALLAFQRNDFRLQTKVGRFIVPGQPNDRDSTGVRLVCLQRQLRRIRRDSVRGPWPRHHL